MNIIEQCNINNIIKHELFKNIVKKHLHNVTFICNRTSELKPCRE